MHKRAVIQHGEARHEFPVERGSEGELGIDISTLRAKSGLVTLDKGYKNTGATTSAITFLDGEKGILRYRGYPIEALAEAGDFIEIVYLLLHGTLPSQGQLDDYKQSIRRHCVLPDAFERLLAHASPKGAHPMGVLSAMVSALSFFDETASHPAPTPSEVMAQATRVLSKLPLIAASTYRIQHGKTPLKPQYPGDYCRNFLHAMFSPQEEQYNDVAVSALNQLLILHADHEQNCSTSTVRMVGSSHANLYASLSAGISALWGPLHGGANQAVIEMLLRIQEGGGHVKKFIEKAKDKRSGFRLMGFGHRVYKNFDPRAKIIKKAADALFGTLNRHDKILSIAKEIEEIALKDSYFVERKLYPNVDFYSGIIYRALGIPTNMFTVLFAMGRLPGWIAQWKEMRENGEPIGRPRQLYTGPTQRAYVPLKDRV